MNDAAARYQGYLVGQLIVTFIAVAALVFGDFGGWYYRTSYVEVTGWTYLGSDLLGTVFIVLLISGFLLALHASVSSLRHDDVGLETLKQNTARSIRGAVFTGSLSILGGILFMLLNLDSDEWWFDVGFYGALLGGILVAFLGKLMHDDIERELGHERTSTIGELLGESPTDFLRTLIHEDLKRIGKPRGEVENGR